MIESVNVACKVEEGNSFDESPIAKFGSHELLSTNGNPSEPDVPVVDPSIVVDPLDVPVLVLVDVPVLMLVGGVSLADF